MSCTVHTALLSLDRPDTSAGPCLILCFLAQSRLTKACSCGRIDAEESPPSLLREGEGLTRLDVPDMMQAESSRDLSVHRWLSQ